MALDKTLKIYHLLSKYTDGVLSPAEKRMLVNGALTITDKDIIDDYLYIIDNISDCVLRGHLNHAVNAIVDGNVKEERNWYKLIHERTGINPNRVTITLREALSRICNSALAQIDNDYCYDPCNAISIVTELYNRESLAQQPEHYSFNPGLTQLNDDIGIDIELLNGHRDPYLDVLYEDLIYG